MPSIVWPITLWTALSKTGNVSPLSSRVKTDLFLISGDPFLRAQKTGMIAAGIEKGIFPANPGDSGKDNCRNCDFERVCAADRDLMWERKASAPELELYLKLIKSRSSEEAGE